MHLKKNKGEVNHMKTRIILLKHGLSCENERELFSCGNDADLTQEGVVQTEHALERIEETIDLLYSGTDLKSVSTARVISKRKAVPLMVSDELDDLYGGHWEGRRLDDIAREWPKEYHVWTNEPYKMVLPAGEGVEEFKNRLLMKFRSLVNLNTGKTICWVTCTYALNLILSYVEGIDFKRLSFQSRFSNASIHIIDIEGGEFKIVAGGRSFAK